MEFLEFEVPIKEILDQIEKCKSIENESDVDITKTYNLLQKKLVETKKPIVLIRTPYEKTRTNKTITLIHSYWPIFSFSFFDRTSVRSETIIPK